MVSEGSVLICGLPAVKMSAGEAGLEGCSEPCDSTRDGAGVATDVVKLVADSRRL